MMILAAFKDKKIEVYLLNVLILHVISSSVEKLVHHEELSPESLLQCTVRIVEEYTTKQDVTSISAPNTDSSLGYLLLKFFHNIGHRSLQVYRRIGFDNSSSLYLRSQIYIIPVSSKTDLEIELPLLRYKYETWSPHAKFILVSTTIFFNRTWILSEAIRILSRQKAYKMIFLLPQDDNLEAFDIHTWLPFSNGNCADSHDTIILDACYRGKFLNNTNLFPNIIPSDLHQCPVTVGTVIFPPFVMGPKPQAEIDKVNLTKGTEILMMNNIAEKMNFSVRYLLYNGKYKWGVLGYLGKPRGIFRLLLEGQCDIGMSSLTQTPERYIYIDPSTTYASQALSWCVPAAAFRPKWESIFQPFNYIIWILILLCIISITIVWFIINSIGKDIRSFSESFLYVFSVFLNISVWIQPKMNSLKCMLILWVVFSLIISTSYQAQLIKFLINPIREKQISNLEQLAEAPLPVGTFFHWGDIVRLTMKERNMPNKFIYFWELDQCLDDIAFHRNYTVALLRSFLDYQSKDYKDKDGNSLLYIFKELVVGGYTTFYAKKGFPLIERMDDIINRFIETGFLLKWKEDTIDVNKYTYNQQHGENVIISLSHLQGAFVIYLIGMSFALALFVLEIFLFNLKVRSTEKIFKNISQK